MAVDTATIKHLDLLLQDLTPSFDLQQFLRAKEGRQWLKEVKVQDSTQKAFSYSAPRVAWEDIHRNQGSASGDFIFDVTMNIKDKANSKSKTVRYVLRPENMKDPISVQSTQSINMPVGNVKGDKLRSVQLIELLSNQKLLREIGIDCKISSSLYEPLIDEPAHLLPDIHCICGETMQRTQTADAYDGSNEVWCDGCSTEQRKQRIEGVAYHCPREWCEQHRNGWDLCEQCAGLQIRSFFERKEAIPGTKATVNAFDVYKQSLTAIYQQEQIMDKMPKLLDFIKDHREDLDALHKAYEAVCSRFDRSAESKSAMMAKMDCNGKGKEAKWGRGGMMLSVGCGLLSEEDMGKSYEIEVYLYPSRKYRDGKCLCIVTTAEGTTANLIEQGKRQKLLFANNGKECDWGIERFDTKTKEGRINERTGKSAETDMLIYFVPVQEDRPQSANVEWGSASMPSFESSSTAHSGSGWSFGSNYSITSTVCNGLTTYHHHDIPSHYLNGGHGMSMGMGFGGGYGAAMAAQQGYGGGGIHHMQQMAAQQLAAQQRQQMYMNPAQQRVQQQQLLSQQMAAQQLAAQQRAAMQQQSMNPQNPQMASVAQQMAAQQSIQQQALQTAAASSMAQMSSVQQAINQRSQSMGQTQQSQPAQSMQSGPQSALIYDGSASIPRPSGLSASQQMIGAAESPLIISGVHDDDQKEEEPAPEPMQLKFAKHKMTVSDRSFNLRGRDLRYPLKRIRDLPIRAFLRGAVFFDQSKQPDVGDAERLSNYLQSRYNDTELLSIHSFSVLIKQRANLLPVSEQYYRDLHAAKKRMNGVFDLHFTNHAAKEKELCVICMDRTITMVMEGCYHMCLCSGCADKWKMSCPICRTAVRRMVREDEVDKNEERIIPMAVSG